jgi:hypothetical protein
MEFQNTRINRNLTEHFPIKVDVAALNIEVHRLIRYGSLFAKVVFNISWFLCPWTHSISKRVWLEKSLEQVIRDLATHEKRQQTSSSIRVGCLDMLDKEVRVGELVEGLSSFALIP